jgi:hypothetical protein
VFCVQVEYQLEFAEWAAASGLEDGAAVANQLLLEAAQILQQHELDLTGVWKETHSFPPNTSTSSIFPRDL